MAAALPEGCDITVSRDGRFWLIHIPALDGYTQACFVAEIHDMARDYVALVTETPVEQVTLNDHEIPDWRPST